MRKIEPACDPEVQSRHMKRSQKQKEGGVEILPVGTPENRETQGHQEERNGKRELNTLDHVLAGFGVHTASADILHVTDEHAQVLSSVIPGSSVGRERVATQRVLGSENFKRLPSNE
jgi:hypothetical protein